jgi:hypothetical protein
VAISLLQNDLHLYQLGFAKPCYERQQKIMHLGQIATHGRLLQDTQLSLLDPFEESQI